LAIMLSVLLQFTDSDYPFGIFKLFLVFSLNFVSANQIKAKTLNWSWTE